jgi:hypothetical protein
MLCGANSRSAGAGRGVCRNARASPIRISGMASFGCSASWEMAGKTVAQKPRATRLPFVYWIEQVTGAGRCTNLAATKYRRIDRPQYQQFGSWPSSWSQNWGSFSHRSAIGKFVAFPHSQTRVSREIKIGSEWSFMVLEPLYHRAWSSYPSPGSRRPRRGAAGARRSNAGKHNKGSSSPTQPRGRQFG